MSLLDMDERLLDIFERGDLEYSPLVDFKEYPKPSTCAWSRAPCPARRTSTRSGWSG